MKEIKPKYKVGQTVLYSVEGEKTQSKFKIKEIKEDAWEDDMGKEHPYYLYYDGDGGFLAENDIDGNAEEEISKETNEINEETLKKDGWEFFSEFGGEITEYKKEITFNNKVFYCDIRPFSNTKGRNWSVHVDNDCCESVGTMDVSTFVQLYRFLELLTE